MKAEDLNPENIDLSETQLAAFNTLLFQLNRIESRYGKTLVVNRGVSSAADQSRINPTHPNDAHVRAAGVDIADDTGEFWEWCAANTFFLKALPVYLEAHSATLHHVHIQVYPPKSGNFMFFP